MAAGKAEDVIRQASRLLGQAAELLTSVPNEHPASAATTRPNRSADAVSEHRRLFAPARHVHFNNRRSDVVNRKQMNRKVKKIVCALASRNSSKVPTPREKTTLKANGLGEKTLFFPSFGSAADVKSVLLREFPRLEEGGGFEILRTMENSRVFLMVTCVGACTVDELMQMSSGRIFVRPIQSSLHIDETKRTLVSSDFEECQICGSLINLADLRDHSKECRKMSDDLPDPLSTNDEEDILEEFVDYPQLSNRAESDSGNSDFTPVEQQSEKNERNTTATIVSDEILSSVADEQIPVEQIPVAENPETVVQIVDKLKDIHDPVLILKEYQKHFLLGRKLDITNESEMLEGETTNIFVSRERILETGFSELMEPNLNFRLPLEVTFYGEEAQDVGGPRKEFFNMLLKELAKEENQLFVEEEEGQFVFTNNDHIFGKKWFYAAGLVCGLSIVQNGPLPTFIKNFDSVIENPTKSQKQFLEGLNEVGLCDVIKAKPCVRFLFQPSAKTDITLRKLKHLLQPKMNETGSNKRKQQEKMYEFFLLYLKEVAAGRREVEKGKITLGDILRFITGSEWEPVLGYTIPPRISFEEMINGSLIPKSSTCINCLYLPVPGTLLPWPERSHLFECYDLAFCNTYFGLN